MQITPIKEHIIKALAQYQYLTNSQIMKLGISDNIKVIRKHVKELSDTNRPFIGSIRYGATQRMGKREYFHYLKKKGVRLLLDHLFYLPEQIKAPKSKSPNITTDYQHRKSTIDFQIAVSQHMQQQDGKILFFDTYYERIGNNRTGISRAKTAVERKQNYLLADALFMIQVPLADQYKKHLYAFEMHNTNSTKNIFEQLYRYLECLELGSITLKYGFDRASRILSVFEDANKMHNTLKRIKAHSSFDNVRGLYLFKPLAEIVNDGICTKWIDASGKEVVFY